MPVEQFSKPSVAVIKNKKYFFEENDKHLNYVPELTSCLPKIPIHQLKKSRIKLNVGRKL